MHHIRRQAATSDTLRSAWLDFAPLRPLCRSACWPSARQPGRGKLRPPRKRPTNATPSHETGAGRARKALQLVGESWQHPNTCLASASGFGSAPHLVHRHMENHVTWLRSLTSVWGGTWAPAKRGWRKHEKREGRPDAELPRGPQGMASTLHVAKWKQTHRRSAGIMGQGGRARACKTAGVEGAGGRGLPEGGGRGRGRRTGRGTRCREIDRQCRQLPAWEAGCCGPYRNEFAIERAVAQVHGRTTGKHGRRRSGDIGTSINRRGGAMTGP